MLENTLMETSVCEKVFVKALTAIEINEEHTLEVPMVDQSSVDSGAGLVIYGEVAVVWIPPKQVVLLLIDDQLLQG